MKKKILTVLLCATMVFSSLVGCGSTEESAAPATGDETSAEVESTEAESKPVGEMATLSLYIPTLANYSEDAIAQVETAMNEHLAENYGIQVDIVYVEFGNLKSTIDLAMTTDEVDVTCYFPGDGGLATYVQNGQLLDITEYFNNAPQELKDLFTDAEIRSVSLKGGMWGLPRKYQYGGYGTAVLNADIANEMGIDAASITSYEALGEVLYQVHEKYPDVYALVPQSGAELTWARPYMAVGGTKFAYADSIDSTELKSVFELDSVREFSEYARQWYLDGLIMPDIISNTIEGTDLVSSGKAFATMHNADVDPLESFYPNTVACGRFDEPFGQPCAKPGEVGNIQYGISANSAHPEEAFTLLQAVYLDKELIEMLCYGIEGEHWVRTEDGRAGLPEGITNENNPYGGYAATAVYPNYLPLPTKVTAPVDDYNSTVKEWNEGVATSKADGFAFDTSEYTDFVTAYTNIHDKYLNAVLSGSVALDDVLPKIKEELSAIGFYEILAEVQTELDAYLAAQ